MATGLGRNNVRLGIPKVNQDPKPPMLKQALGNRIAAPKAPRPVAPARALTPKVALSPAAALTPATTTAQSSNVAATGSTSAASVEAPTAPAPVNTTPFAIPTWNPKVAGEADPRDAAYWQNLSKLQFTDQNEYAKDLQEQTTADSGYSAALQQAIQGRKVQERSLGETAIRGNLGSSGYLDRTQGEQTRDYTQERANASLTKSQEDQARLASRKALEQGYGIEAAGLLGEAAARYAEGAGKEAESGAPEATASTNGIGAPGTNTGPPGGNYGQFQFYQSPNQLPGGNVSKAQPAKPVKAALAKAKKAK
jgi:hypothetical protein